MVFLTIDQAEAIDKFLTDAKQFLINQNFALPSLSNYYQKELEKCQAVQMELRKEIRKVVP